MLATSARELTQLIEHRVPRPLAIRPTDATMARTGRGMEGVDVGQWAYVLMNVWRENPWTAVGALVGLVIGVGLSTSFFSGQVIGGVILGGVIGYAIGSFLKKKPPA